VHPLSPTPMSLCCSQWVPYIWAVSVTATVKLHTWYPSCFHNICIWNKVHSASYQATNSSADAIEHQLVPLRFQIAGLDSKRAPTRSQQEAHGSHDAHMAQGLKFSTTSLTTSKQQAHKAQQMHIHNEGRLCLAVLTSSTVPKHD